MASSGFFPSTLKVGPFCKTCKILVQTHICSFLMVFKHLYPRRATLPTGFSVFLSKFFSAPLLDTNAFYRKCFIYWIRNGVVTIIQVIEKNGAWSGLFYCKTQFLVSASSTMHFLQVESQVREMTYSQFAYGKFGQK